MVVIPDNRYPFIGSWVTMYKYQYYKDEHINCMRLNMCNVHMGMVTTNNWPLISQQEERRASLTKRDKVGL